MDNPCLAPANDRRLVLGNLEPFPAMLKSLHPADSAIVISAFSSFNHAMIHHIYIHSWAE